MRGVFFCCCCFGFGVFCFLFVTFCLLWFVFALNVLSCKSSNSHYFFNQVEMQARRQNRGCPWRLMSSPLCFDVCLLLQCLQEKPQSPLSISWYNRCFSVRHGNSFSLKYVIDSQELLRAGYRAKQGPFLLTVTAIEIDAASVRVNTDSFFREEREAYCAQELTPVIQAVWKVTQNYCCMFKDSLGYTASSRGGSARERDPAHRKRNREREKGRGRKERKINAYQFIYCHYFKDIAGIFL